MEGEEEEEERAEMAYELIKPKKRIGRPPREWSSVLLPKEVTSALGARKSRKKSHKNNNQGSNYNDQVDNNAKLATNMVGQAVHGVVDGCFDAGFLVSLRMGDSEALYRGVVFGPGLSIPLSKDTDIAKNVKRRRRRTTTTIREEPPADPPSKHPPPSTIREEPSTNPTLTQPSAPPSYGASLLTHPQQQAGVQVRGPPTRINPANIPPNATNIPPNANTFGYNGVFNPNQLRPLPHQSELNVNPFLHSSSFIHRPSAPLPPPQGFNPAQNFGHVMPPSAGTQFGYTFGAGQGRPAAPVHPHYQGPQA